MSLFLPVLIHGDNCTASHCLEPDQKCGLVNVQDARVNPSASFQFANPFQVIGNIFKP
jgi:hypothetical protein